MLTVVRGTSTIMRAAALGVSHGGKHLILSDQCSRGPGDFPFLQQLPSEVVKVLSEGVLDAGASVLRHGVTH